ncbi:hypothetical protein [Alloscardovia omnicolens]|uniref:hypothetical protein n=1 Tax=Alloscardovia omnicolens TaxID=419015 RepID=UPI003A647B50
MEFLQDKKMLKNIDGAISLILIALCLFLPNDLRPLQWAALASYVLLIPLFVYSHSDSSKGTLALAVMAYIANCFVIVAFILDSNIWGIKQNTLMTLVFVLIVISAIPEIMKEYKKK